MLILENQDLKAITGALANSAPLFILTHEFHPRKGGIATFTEEMALAAARKGIEVEVWAQNSDEALDEEKNWPFTVRRLDLRGTQDWPCRFTISKEIIEKRRNLRRAAVYLPEPGPISAMLYLQFIKAFQPGHLYLTFHGSEVLKYHSRIHHRLMLGKLIERADRISVVSQFTHRLLTHRFPEAAKKTILTPCALRSHFKSIPRPQSKTDKKVIILTVGRLHPRKGQGFVINALRELPQELKDRVEYWIVGNGKSGQYQKKLDKLIERSGITVKLLRNAEDDALESIYRQADIFAMTSINYKNSVEGFGLVYLEASACGLPVVAHHVGGVPDAVVDGETGLLVPPGDIHALTQAFERLISNPELRHKMGSRGRKWSQKNKWDRSVEALFQHPEMSIGEEEPEAV